jgi:hypothetical protein
MNTKRRSHNPKKCFAPDNESSRNPPSPPFEKGGLGGFQKGIAKRKFALQKFEIL